jgi:hypothetical protein
MKQINTLSLIERHKLNMYIESNRDMAEKHTNVTVAYMASQALAFKISPANIIGALKAVGISKRPRAVTLKFGAVSYVAKELSKLLIELGKEPSEILKQIAERKRMEVTE